MAQNNGPRLIWIFTPLVALSFVGFLFYLTTVPAGNDVDKVTQDLSKHIDQAQKRLSEKGQAITEEGIKSAIKEQLPDDVPDHVADEALKNYQFFELLENSEVQVEEVPEYKSTPKGTDKDGNKIQYRLRTGSFSSAEGADRQKAQLLLNGFDIQIEPAEVNGRTWYRVFTGPFANRSQMNKAQDTLVELGIQSMAITEPVSQPKS